MSWPLSAEQQQTLAWSTSSSSSSHVQATSGAGRSCSCCTHSDWSAVCVWQVSAGGRRNGFGYELFQVCEERDEEVAAFCHMLDV